MELLEASLRTANNASTRRQEIQLGQTADLGIVIALIGVLSGVGILAGAFAGAYFFGKSRAQKETLRGGNDPELLARLARVEQIVESTAIEIERISEGQRFTTKLLSEKTTVER